MRLRSKPSQEQKQKDKKQTQKAQEEQKNGLQGLISTAEHQILKQQMMEFFDYLLSGEKIMILPSINRPHLIQIFNVKNNQQAIPHRIVRKRDPKVQRQKQSFLMFVVDKNYILNCIMLAMTKKPSQKMIISLGSKREEWNRVQGVQIDFKPQQLKCNTENITIFKRMQDILRKPQQIDRNGRGKMREKTGGRSSPFSHVKLLSIQINNQCTSFEQWVDCINICAQFLKIIQKESMNSLERLQIRINDQKRYERAVDFDSGLLDKFKQIYSGIHAIIKSKSILNKDSIEGYFPGLLILAFNPTFYIKYVKETSEELQQTEQQQKIEQAPITKLALTFITQEINDQTYFLSFIPLIFKNFPKLTHLIVEMRDNQLFTLFNELTGELYKYCPLLQSLHILHNKDKIDHEAGLRNVLEFYPFLSDLKIRIWPFEENGRVSPQFQKQWNYVNEIQFRSLQIQRLINMIKILQKKGYNRSQCMEIIQFMKPLKFPTINN